MKKLISAIAVLTTLSAAMTGCTAKGSSGSAAPEADTSIDEAVKPLLDYFEGYNSADHVKIYESYTPAAALSAIEEKGERESFSLYAQSEMQGTLDYWKVDYGDNVRTVFRGIAESSPVSDENLGSIENYFYDDFSDYNFTVSVEQAYELTFRYEMVGDSESAEDESVIISAKLSNDGWKLVFCGEEDLYYYSDEYIESFMSE